MARFRPNEHLRRPADFEAVYERRRSAADAILVVYVRENSLSHSRLGLSVSKKFGTAVRRNRIRRLLREAYRLEKADLSTGYDFVLIPRPLDNYSLEPFRHSLAKLTKQVIRKILKDAETMNRAGETP
ncbi:MAG TPA: ribonuclease P protein component [Gemmataceae bacterium]|nr:ribonuclease P protein component [Gemmataceae bacterium]